MRAIILNLIAHTVIPLNYAIAKYLSAEDSQHDFIGKVALNKIRKDGIKQKIRGIIFDGGPCPTCAKPFPVYSNNKVKIGQITSGIYSPRLKKNVGLSMILKDHWNIGNEVIVETPDNKLRAGTISSLPFPG
jgi:dimethylsulfoniopropionate demethylase